MLERPELSYAEIAGMLHSHHGITASSIRFLPIGNDINSFAFQVVATGGTTYFLKARRGEANLPALVTACFVQAHGVPAVAPIATCSGNLWVNAGDFHLIVYPFIDGASGMNAGMSDAQWIAHGAALRRLHDLVLPADIQSILPIEDFSAYPYYQDVLQRVDTLLNTTTFQDDILSDLAAFWHSKASEIQHIAQRTRELGEASKRAAWQSVLCHADIHTANLMVDQNGAIHFIDWDQPIFAPKERDLMFIMGEQEALFFQGYGAVDIDWHALAYYRHLWVMQDMGDYAERAFLMNDVGNETRAQAAAGFKAMFNAGDVIDIARKADLKINP